MRTLILAGLVALVATPALAQTATKTDMLAWTIEAPDVATAQTLTYRHYDDQATTGIVLAPPIVCTPSPAPAVGTFDCVAPVPAFTPGTHTTALTAGNADGESLRSNTVSFRFVIIPAIPTNVRIIKRALP